MSSGTSEGIQASALIPLGTIRYRRFASRFPEFIELIRGHRSRRRAALSALSQLPPRDQRARTRQLLHSRDLWLLYAFEGLLKAKRLHRQTPAEIELLSRAVDPFSACYEHVRSRMVVAPRKRRVVHSFGPIKRARQHLVADVIRALHPPRENQFMFRGGIPAAVKAVEAAAARGTTHALELDVQEFYGSIPRELLSDLLRPLPDAVVTNVVWDTSIRVPVNALPGAMIMPRVSPPLNDAVGLSLGSASSPIVGEVLIGRLLADNRVDYDADIITYADNLLVLGRSEQETIARAEHLATLALETGNFGALRLREKGRGHLLAPGTSVGGAFSADIPFAGLLGCRDNDGNFSWEPAPEKRNEHRIADGDRLPTLEEISHAERKVAAFHRAYPFWRGRELSEAEEKAALSVARYMRQASPQNMSAAARDIVLAYLLHGGSRELPEFIPDYANGSLRRRERLHLEATSLIQQMAAHEAA